jgi:hypothetical protein
MLKIPFIKLLIAYKTINKMIIRKIFKNKKRNDKIFLIKDKE